MPPPPSLVVAEVGYELSLWQGLGLWEDRVLGCWCLVCEGLVPCSDVSPGGASPPLDGPDGAFRTGQKPGCWLSPDPVTCHHIALHVLSPTDILLVLSAAQRGWGSVVHTESLLHNTFRSHRLSLTTPYCPWPVSASQAAPRVPSGSSPWKFVLWVLGFPEEEVEQAQGQWPLATWPSDADLKGGAAFSLPSPL